MSAEAGPRPPTGETALSGVREEVEQLVRQLDGHGQVARVRVRSGGAMIEIEWALPAHAGNGGATPAAGQPAAPAAGAPAAGVAASGNGTPVSARAPLPDGGDGNGTAATAPGERGDGNGLALHSVRAPLVGTFYVAPEPNAPPFVKQGDLVVKGATIGIIEAMKMMNHIAAERDGRVAELLVADGEAVEFGQELVRIEPLDG